MSATSKRGWPFDVLGLSEGEIDKKAIRMAYATRLKTIDQECEGEAFQALRQAYEAALQRVSNTQTAPKKVFTSPVGAMKAKKPAPVQTPSDPHEVFLDVELEEVQEDPSVNVLDSTSETFDEFPEYTKTHPHKGSSSVDAAEGDDNIGFETNWELVQALCNQVFESEGFNTDAERLRAIWRNPIFQDPEAMAAIEQSVFSYTSTLLDRSDPKTVKFPKEVGLDFFSFLDEAFLWFTDSIQFERKFSSATEIVSATSNHPHGADIFNMDKGKLTWKGLNLKAGRRLRQPSNLLVAFGFSILSGYRYAMENPENVDAAYGIGLYGAVFFLFLQVPILYCYYIFDVERVSNFLIKVSDHALSLKNWGLWIVYLLVVYMLAPFVPEIVSTVLLLLAGLFFVISVTTAISLFGMSIWVILMMVIVTVASFVDAAFYMVFDGVMRIFHKFKRR